MIHPGWREVSVYAGTNCSMHVCWLPFPCSCSQARARHVWPAAGQPRGHLSPCPTYHSPPLHTSRLLTHCFPPLLDSPRGISASFPARSHWTPLCKCKPICPIPPNCRQGLLVLDLSGNQLSGSLPLSWVVLALSGNQLSGSLPLYTSALLHTCSVPACTHNC